MRRPRMTLRWLMLLVALIGLGIGGERMWRRRQRFLLLAAPHARQEAFYQELAADIAGEPLSSPSQTVTALLPDGTAVKFRGVGASRRPHFPPENAEPADAATVARLAALCRKEADKEGVLRREFEHKANRPWMAAEPESTRLE